MAECAIGLAGVAVVRGRPVDAARLIGWAEASLRAVGAEVWPSTRRDLDRTVAAARETLGDGPWERERAAGGTLSFDDVVAIAGLAGPHGEPRIERP
jgi:hypothetical protein